MLGIVVPDVISEEYDLDCPFLGIVSNVFFFTFGEIALPGSSGKCKFGEYGMCKILWEEREISVFPTYKA